MRPCRMNIAYRLYLIVTKFHKASSERYIAVRNDLFKVAKINRCGRLKGLISICRSAVTRCSTTRIIKQLVLRNGNDFAYLLNASEREAFCRELLCAVIRKILLTAENTADKLALEAGCVTVTPYDLKSGI